MYILSYKSKKLWASMVSQGAFERGTGSRAGFSSSASSPLVCHTV